MQEETQLSGTIPKQLSKLHQLDILYIDDTKVSGTIPPEFGAHATKVAHTHATAWCRGVCDGDWPFGKPHAN